MAVIQEAWIGGVSTRRVDDLVQAMGLAGISKSTVSKLCKDIDDRVNAFLERPLVGDWPYLWLDATYLKQREGGQIRTVAVIIAVAVNTEGKREIVGLHIGPSEAEMFWSTFLKSLVKRGLRGTKLVISDAHEGLKAAIRRVLGSTWQRCRVHWMRNAQAYIDPIDFATRHGIAQALQRWPSQAGATAALVDVGVMRVDGDGVGTGPLVQRCQLACNRVAARLSVRRHACVKPSGDATHVQSSATVAMWQRDRARAG